MPTEQKFSLLLSSMAIPNKPPQLCTKKYLTIIADNCHYISEQHIELYLVSNLTLSHLAKGLVNVLHPCMAHCVTASVV